MRQINVLDQFQILNAINCMHLTIFIPKYFWWLNTRLTLCVTKNPLKSSKDEMSCVYINKNGIILLFIFLSFPSTGVHICMCTYWTVNLAQTEPKVLSDIQNVKNTPLSQFMTMELVPEPNLVNHCGGFGRLKNLICERIWIFYSPESILRLDNLLSCVFCNN